MGKLWRETWEADPPFNSYVTEDPTGVVPMLPNLPVRCG